MKRSGWNVLGRVVLCGLLWAGIYSARAEDAPAWDFEVVETEAAVFEVPQLHDKETGWLFTCRMRVKSLHLIKPISELKFKGMDEAEEVIWEKSHTIRWTDFEAAYGGGRSQFVRVFLKDVPSSVVLVELHYGDEEDGESAEK